MRKAVKLIACLLLLHLLSGSVEAKGEKVVAVLPFAVHSAENIDYVKQGIWDMLSSRISVIGKIDVISKESVLQALKEHGGKDLSSADLYNLGKKLNADYTVYGSITKIGNSISIDGKLIDIATNKPATSVFAQSQGMDEVIQKINDFARNIDNHILGMVPSTFSPAAAPPPTAVLPATAVPPPQAPSSSREGDIIAGMKKGKKGTFTSIINPDFINSTSPMDRKGFWMSQKFSTEFRGMDIGDVTGDGSNKTVIIDTNSISIYQKKNNDFAMIHKVRGKSHENYIAVDVADINKNGIQEIIVTNVIRNTVESFVLEYRNGKFEKIAIKLPWFLRVIQTESGTLLLGQRRGFDKPFETPIHEIVWEDGQYKEGKPMKIPVGLSLYGLTLESLGITGSEKVIALDDYDYLNIYEPTDKPLSRIQVFGKSTDRIWKSDEPYGGSNTAIESYDPVIETEDKYTYINLRILTFDTNKDGKKEIIIVKNISSAGRVLKNVKLFSSSEVYNLEWDGLGLTENWKTRKINGYVADYQFKDIDNDGQNEVVLALVLSVGASVSDKSVIVAYKMSPPQTAP